LVEKIYLEVWIEWKKYFRN